MSFFILNCNLINKYNNYKIFNYNTNNLDKSFSGLNTLLIDLKCCYFVFLRDYIYNTF